MSYWKPNRTEFYETAVEMGFYGREDSGLTGKKDNVRKFWEDVFVKLVIRPFIEKSYRDNIKKKFRVLDLGSGSGEGFELLTHIPSSNPSESVNRDFILKPSDIKLYKGIDISPSMISQGKANYRNKVNVKFDYANLDEGLPISVINDKPYDIYFSSYGSLSHLQYQTLETLIEQVFKHSHDGSILFFDIHGKYSPAWPKYWSEKNLLLPYTMAYLTPKDKRKKEKIEWFNVCYWDVELLKKLLNNASRKAGIDINHLHILDRSIFTGRHVDTGIFSNKPLALRYQVSRLLDHGYRGEIDQLEINLKHIEEYKNINTKAWERLTDYQNKWNKVIYLLKALMIRDDKKVKDFIENTDINLMSDDLKFITWLYRNSDRFPVVDFWASIIGPQIAVVLRNIEMAYSEGVGCGHGLMCVLEIKK